MTAPRLLTPREAADQLRISELTLRKWRLLGQGPRYVRVGPGKRSPVRYRETDLDNWVTEHVFDAVYSEPPRNALDQRLRADSSGGRHE